MEMLRTLVVKLVKEQDGGEVIEYSLIAGLIVMSVIAAVTVIGKKILTEWKTVSKAAI